MPSIRPLSISGGDFPNLVWHLVFGEKYLAEVHRVVEADEEVKRLLAKIEPPDLLGYCGELFIFEKEKPYKLLHRQVVHLAFKALYGVDIADIEEWHEICRCFASDKMDVFYENYPEYKDASVASIIKAKIELARRVNDF